MKKSVSPLKKKYKIIPKVKTPQIGGYYDLIRAAKKGNILLVRQLLAAGEDIHAHDNLALILAATNGHKEVVKLLLKAGADVFASNDEALITSSEKGYTEIVKLLLKSGANVNVEALFWAAKNGHTEVVKLLLKAGADVRAKNDYALRSASKNGHTKVVKLLLAAGADISKMNINYPEMAKIYHSWILKNQKGQKIKGSPIKARLVSRKSHKSQPTITTKSPQLIN
jgi:ankyrin repeat protein